MQRAGLSPVLAAVESGHAKVLTALADAGADVNRIYNDPRRYQNDGNTFLHIASQRGNAEVVSALMACNAFLKEENVFGQLPIDVAANDEIRQLINDEMTARFDHGLKRTAIPHPPLPPAVDFDAGAVDVERAIQLDGDDGLCSVGTVSSAHATAAAAASVASEDEDSEESSDEES